MTNEPRKAPRILIVANDGPLYQDRLQTRFPDLTMANAIKPDEVTARLEELQPDVVLSVKVASSPLESHRRAIDHPSVRWFHVGGSGYEHVAPWNAERVLVSNSAGVLARYLAETVTAAILSLNCGLPRYQRQQMARLWQPHPFRPLCDQTLMVVGVGHIGGCVAANAKALGMRVIGLRRNPAPHPSVDTMAPLDELADFLGDADFVSLHLRLTEDTRHLIDRAALAAMKPGAYLINTARGAVVDEAAMIEALNSGRIAGAFLDVFETEPLPAESPLWSMENVMIMPHASDNVTTWPALFADCFGDNLERWMSGRELENRIAATPATASS